MVAIITERRAIPAPYLTTAAMVAECHAPTPIMPARAAWFHVRLAEGIAICTADAEQLERWETGDPRRRPSRGFDFARVRRELMARRSAYHAAAASLAAKPRLIPEQEA
jgi:hypothetical protein